MKCRDMNPGNFQVGLFCLFVIITPSMKCREMNPGNSHSVTRTISKADAESCERSGTFIRFRDQHGLRKQKRHQKMERSYQETSLRALLEKTLGDSALARNKIAITVKFSNNASVMLKVKTRFSKAT